MTGARRTGSLLVAGTTSDAGKSLVTAALCRWLARQGVRVAPFKAQNMSNNSMVCPDGAEIGRAQWLQAQAARVEPEAAMNPVLLKPGSDRTSHVVLMGRPAGVLGTGEWAVGRRQLAAAAFEAFADLRRRYDVVVAEGAGSPTEVNLRAGDYVNMGLARHARLPVVVVGDIDRGGVLAAMHGTLALLDAADQALVAGWVVNKFRGDVSLLQPGLRTLEAVTGRPVLGVVPWLDGVWVDAEDALAVAGWSAQAHSEPGAGVLDVAVIRFPRISNATDVDALATEPGVRVTVTADPDAVRAAHLVVLPGSRSTAADLAWLRARGLAAAVRARAAQGQPVLGICGGYQMLATTIEDDVEGRVGRVPGLGLLPATVVFHDRKQLGRPVGRWGGHPVEAYEIHHGRVHLDEDVQVDAGDTDAVRPFLDGWQSSTVWGTTWHGAFENDGFRRTWLTQVAKQAGARWRPHGNAPGFRAQREAVLERLADAVEQHLDTDALWRLVERGAPSDLPVLETVLRR